MDPIDLSIRPPRSPRVELDGVIFLPRTIDKARAVLPGGNLGSYRIAGITQVMLDQFGITWDAFVAAVAKAESDDDILAFVRENTTPQKIASWNASAPQLAPGLGNRARALERYPWLSERPDLKSAFDVLEEDDERCFGTRE